MNGKKTWHTLEYICVVCVWLYVYVCVHGCVYLCVCLSICVSVSLRMVCVCQCYYCLSISFFCVVIRQLLIGWRITGRRSLSEEPSSRGRAPSSCRRGTSGGDPRGRSGRSPPSSGRSANASPASDQVRHYIMLSLMD